MASIPAPLSISNIPMELTVRGLVVSMKDSFPAPDQYPSRKKPDTAQTIDFYTALS